MLPEDTRPVRYRANPNLWMPSVPKGLRSTMPDAVRQAAEDACDSRDASLQFTPGYIILIDHAMVQAVLPRYVGASSLRLLFKDILDARIGPELGGADTVDELRVFYSSFIAMQAQGGSIQPIDASMLTIAERDTHKVVQDDWYSAPQD